MASYSARRPVRPGGGSAPPRSGGGNSVGQNKVERAAYKAKPQIQGGPTRRPLSANPRVGGKMGMGGGAPKLRTGRWRGPNARARKQGMQSRGSAGGSGGYQPRPKQSMGGMGSMFSNERGQGKYANFNVQPIQRRPSLGSIGGKGGRPQPQGRPAFGRSGARPFMR